MYNLQKYNGPSSRHTCPSCGRGRCFVYYTNEEGKALSPLVGRCDHQNKCGYHYKPADYFRDHPDRTIPEDWKKPAKVVERKLWTIKEDEVRRFRSDESTLLLYLRGLFGEDRVRAAAADYMLGAIADGSTVFWQIDIDGRVRTGKVMQYGPDGHRIKNEDNDRITWMHALLKRDGILPECWELSQCLFGEHLLRSNPDKRVAIVESEKTAVVMSMVQPDWVWLSTGGKFNLNGERLSPLAGRKIYLFPDADAVSSWDDFASKSAQLFDISVSRYAYTDDDIRNKRDIADIVIDKLK